MRVSDRWPESIAKILINDCQSCRAINAVPEPISISADFCLIRSDMQSRHEKLDEAKEETTAG